MNYTTPFGPYPDELGTMGGIVGPLNSLLAARNDPSQFDRRFRVTAGQPPGAITPADHARSSAASRYARQRLLMGLANGLGQGVQPEGFFGNFARSFSGAVGGAYSAGQQQHQQEQDAIKQAAEDQKAQRDYQHQISQDAQQFDQLVQRRISDSETARHNRATEQAAAARPERQMSDLEYFLKDPAGYKRYKELGRAADSGMAEDLPMSQQAIANAALMYAKSGQLPPMGMGKNGVKNRVAIMNYAAANFPHLDIAGNKAQLGANTQALTTVQKQYDMNKAFTKTVHKNVGLANEVLGKIPNAGNQPVNKVLRTLATLGGSDDMQQFHTSMEILRPEFARILQQGTASGQTLTVQSQRDIKAALNDNATVSQLTRAFDVLQRDAENKNQSYGDQIQEIRSRIAWFENPAFIPPAPQQYNPNADFSGQQQGGFDPKSARAKYGY